MLRINIILALSILVMTSCFKEDEMITPHPRGDVKTDTIELTDNYQFQVFYSLDSGRAIRTLDKTSYDLGFESSINGFRIILNTSNFMTISNLGDVPFGSAYDTAGTNMAFDPSSGNLDSNNAKELHQLFFKLRDDFGQTFVIVTHNQEFAAMTDRKLEIKDGKMVN